MVVVDASIWVSSLITADIHHERSDQWLLEQIVTGQVIAIPALALPEIAGAVARRTGNPARGSQAAMKLLDTPDLRVVDLTERLAYDAASIAAQQQIRGADAVYVAAARLLNAPLATLDQELAERVSEIITVLQP